MNQRRQCLKELKKRGFVLKRRGANHDIYFNPMTKQMAPVKRHNFDENDKHYILKEIDSMQEKGEKL